MYNISFLVRIIHFYESCNFPVPSLVWNASVLVNNDDKEECARHLWVRKVNPSNISYQKCS